jgi:signal transduction histidine kinase
VAEEKTSDMANDPGQAPPAPAEPQRTADLARLDLTRLRIEDGVKLDTVFERVTETAADILKVERVGVWLMVDHRRALRCVNLYERSKKSHSAGVTLQVKDFPDYFAALERRKTVPAEIALTDPRTVGLSDAYLVPLGITSMLDAPIFLGGEVVGVLCNEHTGPLREWTTEERDFAGSMADLLALKIRAAEMEDTRHVLRTQAIQLAEARRLEALAEMAAGVAHDFNNLLNLVINYAHLIATDQTASAAVIQYALQVRQAGRQGVALTSELMDFARPGPRLARVVRAGEILAAHLPLLQAAAGERHAVTVDTRSAAGCVLIAPDQLERLVLNLVLNARDAMPDGGPIGVVLREVDEPDEDGQPGRFVLIAVIDQGVGIPLDVRDKIFDPFFTTKPRGQGTGLGLAVASQIVANAGGFIRVETAVGQGSSFRVFLPRVSS